LIRFLDLKRITASFQPQLGEAITRVVDSGFFVRGDEVNHFEEEYASYTGTRYCIGVGNGFDALRLILRAWIVSGMMQEGDEVIVPANTYIASILPVSENRLRPVLVDPDPETFNIDAENIEKAITPRTRAIMVVHLYGRNAMTDEIRAIAEAYHLKIIEDNAQAAGCFWKLKRTGSLGDVAAHSFFPTKNLGALGDGGAVTTDDEGLADTIRTLANYGSHRKGYNALMGINSRLDELQAAVLRVKLQRLDEDNARRRSGAALYCTHVNNPHIVLPSPPMDRNGREHVWHLFVVRCKKREALQKHLANEGVETLIHYPVPPHKQAAFHEWNAVTFPVSEQIHRDVLSLPLSPVHKEAEWMQVVEAVNRFSP